MLKDLRHFENFGTPNYFYSLLCALNEDKKSVWVINDLNQFFFNKIIDGRTVFDGCIPLALKIEIITIQGKRIYLANGISKFLNSKNQMSDKFIEYLFHSLKDDEDFHSIFCSEHLSHDVIYKSLQVSNSAFGFKFSNFKQLLIDFGVIKSHPTIEFNKFIINSRYKKLFDKTVLPEIKRRKVGIEEFRKSVEQKQIYGEEAEKFVLKYEDERLNGNKHIEWIAEYIVNEGYDIASYNFEVDIEYNRFIEVKSFEGVPNFFWSKNEVEIAKLKKKKYFLYLVDRKKINQKDYKPLMIQNPYINVLKNDDWSKDVVKWFIKLKT